MNLIIFILTFLKLYSFSQSFSTHSEYSFLYIVVIDEKNVPGQKSLQLCSAIELVEEQYFLTSRYCFTEPQVNMEMKLAMIKKEKLRFNALFYEPYVLRWETFSEFVILERAGETQLEILASVSKPTETKFQRMEDMPNDTVFPFSDTVLIEQERIEEELALPRENIVRKKSNFRRPNFKIRPPLPPNEDDLPPRVLLTVPSPFSLDDCFTLSWRTRSIEKGNELIHFEGLQLMKSEITNLQLNFINDTEDYSVYIIDFDRNNSEENFVDDIGSPMICIFQETKELMVIGMYIGGNHSGHIHEYRSFKEEFYYITHWAIGTNVSLTGDPASWTLWPIEYGEEVLKSKSDISGPFHVIFYSSISIVEFYLLCQIV